MTTNEQGTNYATQKRSEYEKSLNYLVNGVNTQNDAAVNAINTQYNNQLPDIQDTYNKNVQQAYINKLLAGRQVTTNLAQMGLANSGFGLQANLNNENAYGQNVASLQSNRDAGIRGVEANRANALANQQVSYQELLNNANLQKQQMSDSYYNNEYANYLKSAQMDEQLKQAQWERDYKNRALEQERQLQYASLAARQYQSQAQPQQNAPTSSVWYDNNEGKWHTEYGVFKTPANVGNFGYFGNSYQPRGVMIDGKASKLRATGEKKAFRTYTLSGKPVIVEQNVWEATDKNGRKVKYRWDGSGSNPHYVRIS